MNYKNQKQSVQELRAWAKSKGYFMRKCNANLANVQAYRLYDKANDKAVSSYFTLHDVSYLNNHSDIGFYGLLYSHLIK